MVYHGTIYILVFRFLRVHKYVYVVGYDTINAEVTCDAISSILIKWAMGPDDRSSQSNGFHTFTRYY